MRCNVNSTAPSACCATGNHQLHTAGGIIPPTHPLPPRLLHTPHTSLSILWCPWAVSSPQGIALPLASKSHLRNWIWTQDHCRSHHSPIQTQPFSYGSVHLWNSLPPYVVLVNAPGFEGSTGDFLLDAATNGDINALFYFFFGALKIKLVIIALGNSHTSPSPHSTPWITLGPWW